MHSTAFFLPGARGRLFAVYHPPENVKGDSIGIVHVPAFAEEMNKSRRMVSIQAKDFARRGVGVLVLDLYGTGDSEGDLAGATWEIWKSDILSAIKWFRDKSINRVALWGLRLGGLLALDVFCTRNEDVERAILWQPATSGRQMINQFLRLRVAASMMEGGPKESVKTLREKMNAGTRIDVAGYELTSEFVSAIDDLKISSFVPPRGRIVNWMEISSLLDRDFPAASNQVIKDWRDSGVSVSAAMIEGDSFWAVQEITTVPGLIKETGKIAFR